VGIQIIFFGLFAAAFARKMQLRIAEGLAEKLLRPPSLKKAIAVGMCLLVFGLAGALFAILKWRHADFGPLIPSEMMRITIPAVTSLAIGTQMVFSGFLLTFIDIE
jgi:hypothetical protein